MNASYLGYDIETAPTPEALAILYDVTTRKLPNITKTGQYKNADDIAQWMKQDKLEWEQERIKEYSLSPRFGRVVAWSVGSNVGEPCCETVTALEPENEKYALMRLLDHLGNARYDHVVGFNNKRFDWPFIAIRALILGIDLAAHFAAIPENLRDMSFRYSKRHLDIAEIVNFYAPGPRTGSLDAWCQAFGIPAKTSAGGQIYEWVRQKNHKAIEAHCEGDRQRTVQLWERVQAIV